ncbi:MAG: 30S ribosomal protein S6 [Candidatus Kerfeldbacteria bacterium CG08_land_8_20_14_0_20_43_14]|uniref:Small ribosomal subunit protein bS6 n=1 Tax=Candidatus Kerfeldbacteria bacterium CG08_land_8_20_14_0_20_43_14 TaxID=2014246 RepID=A0A2H0YQ32_9BACT|nr:MAG: 30S ribosomal protein S6 [Candidatus Kerfeldbacteria bacterium CG08_land_8_20_14_0_20_43_14]
MPIQLYNLLAILNGQLTPEAAEEKLNLIKNDITEAGGEVVKTGTIGKRKLAYPVKKQKYGSYVSLDFNIKSENLNRLEKNWRLRDEILRFLNVKIHAKTAKELEEEAKIQEKIQARQAKAEAQEKFERSTEKANEPTKKSETPFTLEDIDKKIDEILDEDIAK